ncbi:MULTISPECIES: TraR/DksA family transcriptional regulator [unclassified Arthrobacter]|uniref:TraR/DksA family transcriptional regulator n=1 Tax=unclassified Arthrobacter TaxID=235627 RepID=UPI0014914128|nr:MULTISPECIES: TraR/DksA C4-type zinc finger protein [unclassified Arthrobacter]MBE0009442.1 molecular chaperone DnaK [Arthrobacter sp. AET 35A]NOJ63509.1 molecular chaperone DnaK [Arthrobacter sp. 147(2020)]
MATDEGFGRYRPLLLEELQRARASSAALAADSRSVSAARDNSNVDDEHDPEGTTIASELSQMSVLSRAAATRAAEIQAALERLDHGTYGRCVFCGDPIAVGRLDARPWTAFCIAHASSSARG